MCRHLNTIVGHLRAYCSLSDIDRLKGCAGRLKGCALRYMLLLAVLIATSKLHALFFYQFWLWYSKLHSENVLWLFASEEYLIKSTDVDSAAEWDVLWVEAVDAKSFQTLLSERVVGRQSWETKNFSILNKMKDNSIWLIKSLFDCTYLQVG